MINIKPHLKKLYRTSPRNNKPRYEYLRLDMNESVSGLPERFIRKSLSGLIPECIAAYPEYGRLQEKIARHNGLKKENICLANGSDAAIKYIFDLMVRPKDKVLFADPTFAMYQVYCDMFDASPLKVSYKNDLSFPTKEFLGKISNRIRIAVIVNPNNPTGSSVCKKDLIAIIEKASKNNVLVIIDEAYHSFYPESAINNVKDYDNLIILRSFSKFYGLASLRLGYAAACPQIVEGLRKVKPTYDVNGAAVMLGEHILDNEDMVRKMTKEFLSGKRYLIQKLTKEGIEYIESEANFILIRCGKNAVKLIKHLAKEGILVAGGFSQPFLKDYVRVTIGSIVSMERFWRVFPGLWRKAL